MWLVFFRSPPHFTSLKAKTLQLILGLPYCNILGLKKLANSHLKSRIKASSVGPPLAGAGKADLLPAAARDRADASGGADLAFESIRLAV